MDTTTQAHTEAMRADLSVLVKELLTELGPTAVQAMTGIKDRTAPSRWARPDGPTTPRDITQQQLRLGYRVWVMMRDAVGPRVAAPWMVGANPFLKENTPITAIRELRAGEVVGAAQAFSDGMFAA